MKNDQNDEWMMQSWAARFFQEKPEASLLIEMLMFHSFFVLLPEGRGTIPRRNLVSGESNMMIYPTSLLLMK